MPLWPSPRTLLSSLCMVWGRHDQRSGAGEGGCRSKMWELRVIPLPEAPENLHGNGNKTPGWKFHPYRGQLQSGRVSGIMELRDH